MSILSATSFHLLRAGTFHPRSHSAFHSGPPRPDIDSSRCIANTFGQFSDKRRPIPQDCLTIRYYEYSSSRSTSDRDSTAWAMPSRCCPDRVARPILDAISDCRSDQSERQRGRMCRPVVSQPILDDLHPKTLSTLHFTSASHMRIESWMFPAACIGLGTRWDSYAAIGDNNSAYGCHSRRRWLLPVQIITRL